MMLKGRIGRKSRVATSGDSLSVPLGGEACFQGLSTDPKAQQGKNHERSSKK